MIPGAQRLLLTTCLVWLLLGASAQAGLFDGNPPGDFLPVEEAFVPSVTLDEGELNVHWRIAEGYYLYRHALNFELLRTNATLGPPQIPDGEKHVDEFFGEVETYRNFLNVNIPFEPGENAAANSGQLQVRYQGCADAGLCYPPQTRVLDLATGIATPTSATPTRASQIEPFVAQQDQLAGLLESGDLAWTLLSFLGLGLLLAFTPCVLPMIPILSGIIVGRGQHISAWRGFALSSVYVLAMALAYTFFGVLAGLFGANLQAALQSAWVLVPFALLFVLLALAMFGFFQLQMPSAVQTRLNTMGERAAGGLAGAAFMGFAAALVVGPCLAPPLAGALLYIGSSGDAILGGLALFALGIGMGLPLIVLGTAGAGVLPRAGAWMDQIKIFFGIVLLGVAIWLLSRVIPGPAVLALWGILLAGYGVVLGALEPAPSHSSRVVKAAGVISLFCAAMLFLGAATGGSNPLRPLQSVSIGGPPHSDEDSVFERVQGLPGLHAALQNAAELGRPAIVDFYADWCVECVHMERTVFTDTQVRRALQPIAALQVNVTDYNAADRDLLAEFGVIGPPTILFFDAQGNERKNHRLIGEVDSAGFVRHLNRALADRS